MTTPSAGQPSAGRILLISFHYGPAAATGGFRWTRLVPLLMERGWSFDIITHDPVGVQDVDERATVTTVGIPRAAMRLAMLLDTAPSVPTRILRGLLRRDTLPGVTTDAPTARVAVTTAPPITAQAPRSLTRRLSAAVDGLTEALRMLSWSVAAARAGRRLAQRANYAAVIVSSPPHITQWAGSKVASRARVPLVPDFRDPWVLGIGESIRNADAVNRALGRVLEPRVNADAACVVHNTERAQVEITADPAAPAVRRVTIPNGYDLSAPPGHPDTTRFIVAFTGHLHPWMDPRPLLAACERLLDARAEARGVMSIVFMGTDREFGGVDIMQMARAHGLHDRLTLRPRGSREEANRLQANAAVLVAFDCTHRLCVPTKFYDYAAMRGSMLLLGHPEGAMADAAAKIGRRVRALDDPAGIDAELTAAFDRWTHGSFEEPNDVRGIHARVHQADDWDALLRSITGAARLGARDQGS